MLLMLMILLMLRAHSTRRRRWSEGRLRKELRLDEPVNRGPKRRSLTRRLLLTRGDSASVVVRTRVRLEVRADAQTGRRSG